MDTVDNKWLEKSIQNNSFPCDEIKLIEHKGIYYLGMKKDKTILWSKFDYELFLEFKMTLDEEMKQ